MSKSRVKQDIERTLEHILGSNSDEFFYFANDVESFYNFSYKFDNFFKTKYGNYHEVFGNTCFKRPNFFRDRLIESLLHELTFIHSYVDVFKLVLCLHYLGVDVEPSVKENVNTNKIVCAVRLIEASSDDEGYVTPFVFYKLYEALSCIDKNQK